jgi:SnoaL-like domain
MIRDLSIDTADALAIHRLIDLYGHIVDEGEWSQLADIVTDDFEYDLSFYGWGIVRGIPELLERWRTAVHPLGHHATNIVVWQDGTGVHVHSKGIGVKADGTMNSNVYVDEVRRTAFGWRIARRRAYRREPSA